MWLIHPSAWKGSSANFGCSGVLGVHRGVSTWHTDVLVPRIVPRDTYWKLCPSVASLEHRNRAEHFRRA